VRGIEDALVGLSTPRVRGDEGRTAKNADVVDAVGDLDVLANQRVRHAIPDRLDVDEGIRRDPATEALLATGQRPRRQWPEGGGLLTGEAIDRTLVRRTVDAAIRFKYPRGEVGLERGEGIEGATGERIALDVFDAGLHFALAPGAIGRAGARLHVPIPTEREIRRMKGDGTGRAVAPEHQRACVVTEQRFRDRCAEPEPAGPALEEPDASQRVRWGHADFIDTYRGAISALNSGEPFMSSRPDGPLGRSVADFARKVDEQLAAEVAVARA